MMHLPIECRFWRAPTLGASLKAGWCYPHSTCSTPAPPLSAIAIKPVPSHSRVIPIFFSINYFLFLYRSIVPKRLGLSCGVHIRKYTVRKRQLALRNCQLALRRRGVDCATSGKPMYSRKQFAALEAMCRERAALARTEMEYALTKYWLAEAEEWRQLRQAAPFKERIVNRPSDLAESSNA